MINTFVIEDRQDGYVDSEFRSIVTNFKEEALIRGFTIEGKISIIFDLEDDEPGVVGACFITFNRSYVRIRTETWPFLKPEEREMLIFHELAHCLLKRKHCSYEEDGEPISLMYPNILKIDLYKKKRTGLIDELFSQDKRCSESN